MNTLLIVLALFIVLILTAGAVISSRRKGELQLPYEKQATLFSPAERSFLGVLDEAAPAEYRVFGKVRIADVVNVKKLSDRRAWTIAFNKISSKHFDYVVCKADDLSIACVVELDDKSHAQENRKKRDVFVEGVCSASSLPLLRVPARKAYAVSDIRDQLLLLLRPDGDHVAPAVEKDPEPVAITTVDEVAAAHPNCPKCSSGMQLRKLTSGAKAGTSFWGCDNFPTCRGCIAVATAEAA